MDTQICGVSLTPWPAKIIGMMNSDDEVEGLKKQIESCRKQHEAALRIAHDRLEVIKTLRNEIKSLKERENS